MNCIVSTEICGNWGSFVVHGAGKEETDLNSLAYTLTYFVWQIMTGVAVWDV
jgi:hypothetical protein